MYLAIYLTFPLLMCGLVLFLTVEQFVYNPYKFYIDYRQEFIQGVFTFIVYTFQQQV